MCHEESWALSGACEVPVYRAGMSSCFCEHDVCRSFASVATRKRAINAVLLFRQVMAEVVIDSGCATIAEVRKRGDEFWDEFEFYMSDMLVGLVMDVFVITCIAPVAVIGRRAKSAQATGLSKLTAGFPSAVFEKSIPGVREYNTGQRLGCLLQTAVQYGTAGLISGLVGQVNPRSDYSLRLLHLWSGLVE